MTATLNRTAAGLYVPHPERHGRHWTQVRSGLIVPEQLTRKGRHRYGPGVLGLDLFAGAGGFSCGMKQAGIEVIGMFEYAADATITYMMNLCRYGQVELHWATPEDAERLNTQLLRETKRWKKDVQQAQDAGEDFTPEQLHQLDLLPTAGSGWISHHPEIPGTQHVFFGDIRKFSGQQVLKALELAPGELDVLFGGPPCQGFSTAGKRNVVDPRNSLIFEFARLIVELKPQTFVLENVPGITSMVTERGIPVLDEFCAMVAEGGWATMEALQKMLGVPGRRGAVRARGNRANKEAPEAPTAPEEPTFGPLFSAD
ncbi:DNA cytosine methyltransferase [Deinococcus sp. HMF7604]|uniref:DNA cytosine methyltransferase n=1 Tax=Deinococcus betulae TaxID=2873312 RepID=UPI001CCBAC69|nr:DNA cytosine methyltransferase [Deinococcus betulae]MBZ9753575.1 DNA cytosine methyltransferase [Deinococcus betulae]